MRKTPRIERMQRHHIHPRRDVQVAEKCDLKRRADKALLPMCAGHQEQSLLCIGIAEGRDVNGEILALGAALGRVDRRSEEHTSELQSLMRTSYAVFCLKKKINPRPAHSRTSSGQNE